MTEEQLQRNIEEGLPTKSDADALAYRKVFDALRKEPTYALPPGFARGVVERLLQLRARKEQKRDNLWLFLGVFFITIAMVVAIAVTDFNPNLGAFTFLNSYGGLLLFGVAFVLFLNWVEKRIRLAQNGGR